MCTRETSLEAPPCRGVPGGVKVRRGGGSGRCWRFSEDWSKSGEGTVARRPFSAELVREIYETELTGKEGRRKSVPLHRVMVLEVSQYLENYLWLNFDPEASTFEHAMSMILMINEMERELSVVEKTNYLVFMTNYSPVFHRANMRGESAPSPWFYQNEGEADAEPRNTENGAPEKESHVEADTKADGDLNEKKNDNLDNSSFQ